MNPIINRQVMAWALYDWGNSAFALSVLAVLFPLFLGSYWSVGDDGSLTVDTGTIIQGPAIGTNTTGQEAEGPNCIGQSTHE